MSKKLFFLPVLMLLAIAVLTPSCGDKCKEDKCANGQCDDLDGTCLCDAGYEYDKDGSCTVKSQDKYVGTYTVVETCQSSNPVPPVTSPPFLVGISAGASLVDLNMTGFYGPTASGGFGAAVKATIEGNAITIARQQPDNDKIYVQGTGTIDASVTPVKITMNYVVTDESDATAIVTNTCTNVTFTRN